VSKTRAAYSQGRRNSHNRPSLTELATPISRAKSWLAVAFGLTVTLFVTGYTFGQSNHHVYLLDALRIQHHEVLDRDWFTNNTLQYHVLFTRLVLALKQIGALSTGFFTLYLGLAITMHVAWLSIVRRLGGGVLIYLLSVVLYHLNAGGLGLGVYQFLQDGSFLPSNISSVAALVALALHLHRRLLLSAIAVGMAGLFHVNYALFLVGCWTMVSAYAWCTGQTTSTARFIFATSIALTPCLINVGIAAVNAMQQTQRLPMADFVALYVQLRHEHHHDPLRWPAALWISFLWPIPLAVLAMRRLSASIAGKRLNFVFLLTLGVMVFAFVFAGIWFVSDKIVLMSLWRFSIFPKLISCVYAAWILVDWMRPASEGTRARRLKWICFSLLMAIAFALLGVIPWRDALPASVPAPTAAALAGLASACALVAVWTVRPLTTRPAAVIVGAMLSVAIFLASQQRTGVQMPGEGDADMYALCTWARTATPATALFLTPPQDATFSLDAQRSSVVGFKQVPQLSGELVEWRRRLERVLDTDILTLPRPMPLTLRAIAERYAGLPGSHLEAVAREFDCDYVITMAPLDGPWTNREVYVSPRRSYYLYRLGPG
jgi:hypothetical protein